MSEIMRLTVSLLWNDKVTKSWRPERYIDTCPPSSHVTFLQSLKKFSRNTFLVVYSWSNIWAKNSATSSAARLNLTFSPAGKERANKLTQTFAFLSHRFPEIIANNKESHDLMCRHQWFGSCDCFRYQIWRPEEHKWTCSDTAQRLTFSFTAPIRQTHAQELIDQSNSVVDAVVVRPVHSGITIINQWPSVTQHKFATRLQVPSFI